MDWCIHIVLLCSITDCGAYSQYKRYKLMFWKEKKNYYFYEKSQFNLVVMSLPSSLKPIKTNPLQYWQPKKRLPPYISHSYSITNVSCWVAFFPFSLKTLAHVTGLGYYLHLIAGKAPAKLEFSWKLLAVALLTILQDNTNKIEIQEGSLLGEGKINIILDVFPS